MFSYDRLNKLVQYFLLHKNGPISSSNLSHKFNISSRTLRNDIHLLNKELKPYNAKIKTKRGEGYYLSLQNEASSNILYEITDDKADALDSMEKRINHLLIKLLYSTDYLSQDDLANEVFISINTLNNYLKIIRGILVKYNLTLKAKTNIGYFIIGNEANKRKCILNVISSTNQSFDSPFSNEQVELFGKSTLCKITNIVNSFNHQNNLHFSDYNLRNLILHIALSISRANANSQFNEYKDCEDISTESFLLPLVTMIEKEFHITFTDGEKNYIYSHFITNTNDFLSPSHSKEYIQSLVNKIIHTIYDLYRIDLSTDFSLEADLNHHLQSIYNTRYYNLNKKNPLLNTIKSNYIMAYEIAETAIKQVLENDEFKLNDDEIGYISLHIGASIERYFETYEPSIKNTIIVYDNGYASGSFLQAKLKNIFGNAINIVGLYPSNELKSIDLSYVDFIVSTRSIQIEENIPVIQTEFPLSRDDIYNIKKVLNSDNINTIDKIQDFFDDNLFIKTKVDSKNTIIHILCEMLKKQGYVNDAYESSVLEREAKISTLMDGVIALPHPLEINSNTSKVAIALLENPIHWSDQGTAQIILMLAIDDMSKKDIEKLYDTFVEIMNNRPLQKLLMQSSNLSEFLDVLRENVDI